MVFTSNEEMIISECCYENFLIPNVTKRFVIDELIRCLTNGFKHFAPSYKIDHPVSSNLEDISIAKFRISTTKNISNIKNDSIPIILNEGILKITILKRTLVYEDS